MPKHNLPLPCFLFSTIFLVSCSSTGMKQTAKPVQDVLPQQKQEVSAIYQECLSEKHGEILNCIQKRVHELDKDVPVLSKPAATTTWKSSEEYRQMNNPLPLNPSNLEKGQTTYQFYCSACHGLDGRGTNAEVKFGRKISDLTDSKLNSRSDGELFWKITEGGWPMPAFWEGDTLSENDIWMLIQYVRSLSAK